MYIFQFKRSIKSAQFKLDKRAERPVFIAALGVLLCLGIGLRFQHLDIQRRSPDEIVYVYQGAMVAKHSVQGTRRLADEYIKDKRLWIYPPPIRIGYNYLLATVMKISGSYNETAGSYISAISSIGTLFLLLIIGLRFFNPWITLAALLAMIASPMDLAIARRCWQDSFLAFAGTLLVYLCAEKAASRRKYIIYLPISLIGAYCLLIKESGIIIFGLCILWLFLDGIFIKRSLIEAFLACFTGIAGLAASLFVLIKVTGGMPVILNILKSVKDAMPTNTYALEYQTGPWYRLIQGFWILTPLFTGLAFLGFAGVMVNFGSNGLLLKEAVKRWEAVCGIIFFAVTFMIIAIVTPYCQNMRYLSVAFVPFYLLSGLGLWLLMRLAKERLGNSSFPIVIILVVATVIIAAFADYARFSKIFLEKGVIDTSIRLLRQSI